MFRNKRPLVYLLTAVVGVSLVAQQQSMGVFSAFASESSPRDSGYDHGCDDAGISDPGERYINQPEKGPSFHTGEFMAGYNDGFDSCGGGGGNFEEPESNFGGGSSGGFQDSGERYYEGWNWRQICSQVDNFLSESCNDLVTSDGNALTAEGKVSLERIACGGQTLLGVLLTNNLLSALQGLRC